MDNKHLKLKANVNKDLEGFGDLNKAQWSAADNNVKFIVSNELNRKTFLKCIFTVGQFTPLNAIILTLEVLSVVRMSVGLSSLVVFDIKLLLSSSESESESLSLFTKARSNISLRTGRTQWTLLLLFFNDS